MLKYPSQQDLHYALEGQLFVSVPEAKKVIKQLKSCPIHKLKPVMLYDYDDSRTYAHITKYCCLNYAQTVAKALESAQLFDYINIENN